MSVQVFDGEDFDDDFSPPEDIKEIIKLSFNNNGTRLLLVHENGARVYSVTPFKIVFDMKMKPGELEIDHVTNTLASSTPSNLELYDISTNSLLFTLKEYSNVKVIRFSQNYLVGISLTIDSEVRVFERSLEESRFNVDAIFWKFKVDLGKNTNWSVTSCSSKGDFLAIPSAEDGVLAVYDLKRKTSKRIKAHQNILQCMSLNCSGSLIATTSTNGKNINVFSSSDLQSTQSVRSFRRGFFSTEMYCLCFSSDSNYLCCYSSSGTVHVFSLQDKGENLTAKLSGLSYIPGFSYFNSEWSKKKTSLKEGEYGICRFDPKNSQVVYVVTKMGQFIRIDFSIEDEEERFKSRRIL